MKTCVFDDAISIELNPRVISTLGFQDEKIKNFITFQYLLVNLRNESWYVMCDY